MTDDATTAAGSFARYRLLGELGRGGMADVFLAVTEGPGGFNKLLVIKQLRTSDDPAQVGMFLDEARLAARVNHPNVVQTFEVVQEPGRAFMVMEFLDGVSLSRIRRAATRQGQRVPLAIELKILNDALLGLHAAHELKGYDQQPLSVVHRDFTPQNLVITYDGDVKIVDFGIAKAHDQRNLTSAGFFKGKLTYVPPEQLLGQPVDRRADVFAAGVMLFEAVTGNSPWKDLSNAEVTQALVAGKVPRLLEVDGAPPELAAICDQAMAVDADDRFGTADELRLALEEFVVENGLQVDRVALGRYVTALLEDERKRTHELIDEQLKRKPTLPNATVLSLALPNIDGLTPPPAAKMLGRSVSQLLASERSPDTGHEKSPAQAPTSHSLRAIALGAIGALVVMVVVVVPLLLRSAASPVPAPAPNPPPVVASVAALQRAARPVPEPAHEQVAEKVVVRIQASPATAHIFIDDLEVPSNPFSGEFVRNAALHELRVVAVGYDELKRGVQFQEDRTFDLALTRQAPKSPPPTARTSAPVRPPVRATAESPLPELKPSESPSASEPEYFGTSRATANEPEYFGAPRPKTTPLKLPFESNIEFK